jgi:hypothetical protein
MIKGFLVVLFIVIVAPIGMGSGTPDFSGIWVGKFEPSQFSGEMELTLTRDGDAWKAEAKFKVRENKAENPVRELEIKDDQISFRAMIGRIDVLFTGKLDGNKIKGVLEASRNGNQIDSGAWLVTRKK